MAHNSARIQSSLNKCYLSHGVSHRFHIVKSKMIELTYWFCKGLGVMKCFIKEHSDIVMSVLLRSSVSSVKGGFGDRNGERDGGFYISISLVQYL